MSAATVPLAPGRRASLRRRLVLVVIAAVAVVAATMGAVSTLALRSTLVDQLDNRLLESAERATKAEDFSTRPAPPDAPTDLGSTDGSTDGSTGTGVSDGTATDGGTVGTLPTRPDDGAPPGLITIGQGAGTLTLAERSGDVQAGWLDQTGTANELDATQQQTLLEVPTDGEPHTVSLGDLGDWRVIAYSTRDTTIVTGLTMQDITSTVDSYLLTEALVAGVGLLVVAVAGAALVRREMQPLERVAATATRVSEQPLHRGVVTLERVPEQDTDDATEVGQVGVALNRMLDHVESALAARHESETQVRQFVADASHELRTPLASIRGYAELVRRRPDGLPDDAVRAMERVESEARRMTTLVEDLLLLARLDAGRALDRDEVDLTGLAVDAVADAHVAGQDHVWRLDLGDQPEEDEQTDDLDAEPTVVLGDDHRLRQVLVNLLANARVHTPAGTTVTTSVRREDDEVVVRVSDDGPGIPEELVPRLFQRFTRGDAARSPVAGRQPGSGSTGLGLAIVHAVVTAHHGRIEVDGTPGATTFTVRLPAADAEVAGAGVAGAEVAGAEAEPDAGTPVGMDATTAPGDVRTPMPARIGRDGDEAL